MRLVELEAVGFGKGRKFECRFGPLGTYLLSKSHD
jgi:hypothetical protein